MNIEINSARVLELTSELEEAFCQYMKLIGGESITGADVVLAFDAALMSVKEKMIDTAARSQLEKDNAEI